ncbi:MAG TPA: hypothetical protein VNV85_18320 [Puia sp.]|jgi:hypothetical protein|nr:hypothetical protein [Puia sp.]
MWNLIEESSMIDNIFIGKLIAQSPQGEDRYVVKSIQFDGYVLAIHSNGKKEIKFFPVKELIEGKWWVDV